jgi:hypothetical protein
MLTNTIQSPATSHRQLYDLLPVLNAEQITKLRDIVIGAKSPSAFTDEEISDLKNKLQQRQTYTR